VGLSFRLDRNAKTSGPMKKMEKNMSSTYIEAVRAHLLFAMAFDG
jgi:hypothetical protein